MIAVIVQPPDEIVPSEELEDTHELLSIPRRYQELLAAYREARRQPIAPHGFRAYLPGNIRQDFVSFLRVIRIPDIFMRGFRAAASVLVELREMLTAQLSALEAYHRINLKYVKRRLRPLKLIGTSLLTILVVLSRELPSVITAMEKREMSANLRWDTMWASILAFGTQPSNRRIITFISAIIVGVILGLILTSGIARRMQGLLEPFGDILTVALAHRQTETLTTQSLE